MHDSKLLLALLTALALNGCSESDRATPEVDPMSEDVACERDGEIYAVGDVIPSADGAQSCVCLEGGEVGRCTGVREHTDAGPNGDACERDGEIYEVGDVIPTSADPVQSCVCLEGGVIGWCTGAN
jgi:hypothetical protein